VVDLLKGDTVIKRSIEKIGINNGDLGTIRQDIQISRVENTDILEIIVNSDNRENVEKLADEIVVQGISLINDVLPIKEINTIQETSVSEHVINMRPNVNFKYNIVLGGVLGFIGIVFLIFLKHAVNNKISSEEDVKRYLGVKVLVSIPNRAHDLSIKRYFRIR
jgi:capsular polysaccharide biosynthesis protein